MPQHCSADGCKSRADKGGSGISFHSYPLKNPELLAKWMNNLRRVNFTPSIHSKLCSLHFTHDSYQKRPGANIPLLKKDAVPTVFISQQHLREKVPSRKPPPPKRRCASDSSQPTAKRMKSDGLAKNTLTADTSGNNSRHIHAAGNPTEPIITSSPTKKKLPQKMLQQNLRRRPTKINKMKDLLESLRRKNLIGEVAESLLAESFSGLQLLNKDPIKNDSASSPNGYRYSKEVKRFSMTLYYQSPKAYRFARSHFRLPHVSLLQKWCSNVEAEPGFLTDAFNYLQKKTSEQPWLADCGLVLGSMSIRKCMEYNSATKSYAGYVDYGGAIAEACETLASEVLVFMVVSLVGKFKFPVAYFLTDKVAGNVQCQLIRVCLEKLDNVGIRVWTLTLDGCASSVRTVQELGVNFTGDVPKLTTHFLHPTRQYEVYVIFDPCHMLKLARNSLADLKVLQSLKGTISWNYVAKLHELQEKEVGNKLSRNHVQKLKVCVAAQTLSGSVASALHFLRDGLKLKEFMGSEATCEFMEMLDKIFDLCNSKNPFAKGYKAALRLSNQHVWLATVSQAEKYLTSLQIVMESGRAHPIILHRRKTFVIGFLLTLKSLKSVAMHFLTREVNPLNYVITYRFSQDHLEMHFAKIRGWNNNPSSLQVKRLLCHVQASSTGNCRMPNDLPDPADIFEFRSSKRSLRDLSNEEDTCRERESCVAELLDSCALSEFTENVLYYIGGFIVRRLMKTITCQPCMEGLVASPVGDHNYSFAGPMSVFTDMDNNGGLIKPSAAAFTVVKACERAFRVVMFGEDFSQIKKKSFASVLVHSVFRRVCHLPLFQGGTAHDLYECEIFDERHSFQVIKKIAECYFSLRLKTYAKNFTTENFHIGVRQKLMKRILFCHESTK